MTCFMVLCLRGLAGSLMATEGQITARAGMMPSLQPRMLVMVQLQLETLRSQAAVGTGECFT